MALFPTFGAQVMPALSNNSESLLQLGAGLLGGRNAQEQLAGGVGGFAQSVGQTKQRNRTAASLRAAGYGDLADGIENGSLSGADAFKLYYAQKLEAQKPKNNFLSAGGSLYDVDNRQWISPPSSPGGGEFGLNVIYGTDANGNTVLGQVGKDGSFHQVDTKGFKPVGTTSNLNLGTMYETRDKAGNVLSSTPIDNAGKALDETAGKNLAANQQALPQVEASANQMLSSIDSLASDPYLPEMVGPYAGKWAPNVTADANRVQSKMDQIGGQSFLQAFNMLRGAGQITEQEGAKATAAMGRLNTAQSLQDYKQALGELRSVVEGAITRARSQAGQPAPVQSGPSGNTGVVDYQTYFGK